MGVAYARENRGSDNIAHPTEHKTDTKRQRTGLRRIFGRGSFLWKYAFALPMMKSVIY